MLYILPYKLGSRSAKALATSLNALRVRGQKRLGRSAVVINWGNKLITPFNRRGVIAVINTKEAVAQAANKITTFSVLTRAGVVTVPWTVDIAYAKGWIKDSVVMCRHTVTSSQGAGIEVVQPGHELPRCPLFTKFIPKAHEYRVHVAFGKVIDFTKKRRQNGGVTSDYIKNYANGWVFCREDAALPTMISEACVKAIAALGLHFGAVDVLYKEKENKYYILEVNTAPGIEGSTLTSYVKAFKERIGHVG